MSIDAFRRRAARDDRYAALARDLGEGGALTGAPPGPPGEDEDVLWDPDRIDVIYVIFTAGSTAPSWDRSAIRRGRAALARAERAGRGLGPYGLQAAIAECHAVAPTCCPASAGSC